MRIGKFHTYVHREFKSEINITPLLDVFLVLLLIFIATTPIVTHNIDVNLPNVSESKTTNTKNPTVIIKVFELGRYSMVINEDHLDQLLPDQLIAESQSRLKLNPKTIFLISGEKNIPYEEIIKTINILRNLGVKSVGLITHPTLGSINDY